MIIQYVHHSSQTETKTIDTEKALKNNPFINKTQKEFDQFVLKQFKRDVNNGFILGFEIIKE